MQNVLGTCLAIVILGGGFALTGDLAHFADRSLKVIQATGIPDDEAPIPVTTDPVVAGAPRPAVPSANPVLPVGGMLDAVDISGLAPGSRVVVWIRHPGLSKPGDVRLVTCDIVDPAGREALVSEIEPPPAAGEPAFAPAPPRRAIVAGSGPTGTIVRGGTLEIRPQGIAGTAGCETIGPVFALDVQR